MDIKAFPALIVGVVVALVLAGATLPVFNDVGHYDVTNEYGTMAKAPTTGTEVLSFIWDGNSATAPQFTINGDDNSNALVFGHGNISIPLIFSDRFTFYATESNGVISQFRLATCGDNGKMSMITSIKSATITLNDGGVTVAYTTLSDTTGSKEVAYNWLFYPSISGDYSIINRDLLGNTATELYYNDINQVYGANWVYATGDYWFSFHGLNVVYSVDTEITATVDSSQYANDVYGFTASSTVCDYSFIVDNNGSDYSVKPYYLIVPRSVSGETLGASPAITALMDLLPVIIIAGLVMGAVTWFIVRKR